VFLLSVALIISGYANHQKAYGAVMQKDRVVVRKAGDTVAIENNSVRLEYNLSKGQYIAVDKRDTSACITGMYSQINDFRSNLPEFKHTWKSSEVIDELGKGKKLTVVSSARKQPSLIFEIGVPPENCTIFSESIIE
jgi:predicted GNAT superfamily acetyltransferase